MTTIYASYPVVGGGIGTVTSVDVSGGTTGITTSGGPITTSGVITLAGTLNIGHGGTGQVTAAAAFNALAPTTTKGDLIAFSSTNARLAVGTNGQVLTADSAQTLGIKWATPTTGTVTSVDVSGGTTGLTTSGGPITSSGTITIAGTLAIANGGTGQVTANAAFNALAPTTTKGDLIAFSSVNARLAVGTNGQVLTADSAQTLGVKWATPTTGTVTSVDVSGGSTGLTYSGGPITSSGTITMAGTLAIGSGGTGQVTANAAFNALAPTTTKGDLIGFSTVNARLAVGSNTQVLTADSTQTLGVKWATPTTGTVTSVDVSGGTTGLTTSGGPVTSSGTITLAGTLGVANGGTGAVTLTSLGVLYGNGTSAVGITAAGTTGQVLTATTSSAPTWQTPTATTAPTVQTLTASSGTYTKPTGPSPLYIHIKMVGAGGGGGGAGNNLGTAGGAGGTGGNTTFGSSLLTANGGGGGGNVLSGTLNANPGTASLGSGPIGIAVTGSFGGSSIGVQSVSSGVPSGGAGGCSYFGGNGLGGQNAVAGGNATANTGSGGGGAGGSISGTTQYSGGGGSSGGYIDAIINSPASTYAYAIGAGGTAGTAGSSGGNAGGTGGSGVIYVFEYYQ